MSEKQKTDFGVRHALAGLDAMAEQWANEVQLSAMVAVIADKDDRESRIEALCKQSFVEGAYRLFLRAPPA